MQLPLLLLRQFSVSVDCEWHREVWQLKNWSKQVLVSRVQRHAQYCQSKHRADVSSEDWTWSSNNIKMLDKLAVVTCKTKETTYSRPLCNCWDFVWMKSNAWQTMLWVCASSVLNEVLNSSPSARRIWRKPSRNSILENQQTLASSSSNSLITGTGNLLTIVMEFKPW